MMQKTLQSFLSKGNQQLRTINNQWEDSNTATSANINRNNNEKKNFKSQKNYYNSSHLNSSSSSSNSLSSSVNSSKKITDKQILSLEEIDFDLINEDSIQLSRKQFEVLETILNGKSVFFTGAAGTGYFLIHLSLCLSFLLF